MEWTSRKQQGGHEVGGRAQGVGAVGERSNFKNFLRTRKIMVMHSNERRECCPRTLVDRKRKRYNNAVDVVVRLHDRPILSTERTTPPHLAHVQLGDVPRTHDPVELPGRGSSARRRGDGDDDATGAGLRLSTATILPRWTMVEGGHHTRLKINDQLVSMGCPPPPYIKEWRRGRRPAS